MISIPLIVATTSGQSEAVKPGLEWVTPPPATGTVNTDYTATWRGGEAPYDGTITNGSTILNIQDGDTPAMTLNADGTNQPTGEYTWLVTDSNGATLTAKTVIS